MLTSDSSLLAVWAALILFRETKSMDLSVLLVPFFKKKKQTTLDSASGSNFKYDNA